MMTVIRYSGETTRHSSRTQSMAQGVLSVSGLASLVACGRLSAMRRDATTASTARKKVCGVKDFAQVREFGKGGAALQ